MASTPTKMSSTPKSAVMSPDAAMLLSALQTIAQTKPVDPQKVWDNLEVKVEHKGRAITLPAEPVEMSDEKAVEALNRRIKDNNQDYRVNEVFDAYPTDAAVAMVRAMNKLYGFNSPQTRNTMFGPVPPQMLSVKVGFMPDEVVQVPMGDFKLPGVDQTITTYVNDRNQFCIRGVIKKKDKHIILELVVEAKKFLKEQSIYRGRAIRLLVDDDGNLMTNRPPEFMDVRDTTVANLIFDGNVQDAINTNLLTPVMHTERCRQLGIPLKRGVLLEGPYGTGKTLLARLTANVCEQNKWTFVMLDKVQGLKQALEFAVRYAPAVVFSEDIDRIMTDRDDDANDLVNIVDGVVSKNTEVMVVLTTNHVDKIAKVMLRPGRLDAIISLRPPQAEAVDRLVRFYAGDLLPADTTLTATGKALAGLIPASIRECVERAKLGMISRGDSQLADNDLVIAKETMGFHLDLLNEGEEEQSVNDRFAEAFKELMGDAVNGYDTSEALAEIDDKISVAGNGVTYIKRDTSRIREMVENNALLSAPESV